MRNKRRRERNDRNGQETIEGNPTREEREDRGVERSEKKIIGKGQGTGAWDKF